MIGGPSGIPIWVVIMLIITVPIGAWLGWNASELDKPSINRSTDLRRVAQLEKWIP